MLLFGHPLISTKPFYRITCIEDIAKTPSNSVVISDFDIDIAIFCSRNGVNLALHVSDVRELILATNLNASFFIVKKEFAIEAQKVANEYLFDGKVLLFSNNEADIGFAAKEAIDGILFKGGVYII